MTPRERAKQIVDEWFVSNAWRADLECAQKRAKLAETERDAKADEIERLREAVRVLAEHMLEIYWIYTPSVSDAERENRRARRQATRDVLLSNPIARAAIEAGKGGTNGNV